MAQISQFFGQDNRITTGFLVLTGSKKGIKLGEQQRRENIVGSMNFRVVFGKNWEDNRLSCFLTFYLSGRRKNNCLGFLK